MDFFIGPNSNTCKSAARQQPLSGCPRRTCNSDAIRREISLMFHRPQSGIPPAKYRNGSPKVAQTPLRSSGLRSNQRNDELVRCEARGVGFVKATDVALPVVPLVTASPRRPKRRLGHPPLCSQFLPKLITLTPRDGVDVVVLKSIQYTRGNRVFLIIEDCISPRFNRP